MQIRDREDILFCKYDMFAALEAQKRGIAKAVDEHPQDKLLGAPIEELCVHLVERFRINVPELDSAGITVSKPREVEIDISGDYRRAVFDRRRSAHVTGTEVTFSVPFTGDRELFFVRPTTFNLSPPRAYVSDRALEFSYRQTELVPETLRKQFDAELASAEQFLRWQQHDVAALNSSLPQLVLQLVLARREKLQRTQVAVSALGFPIKG